MDVGTGGAPVQGKVLNGSGYSDFRLGEKTYRSLRSKEYRSLDGVKRKSGGNQTETEERQRPPLPPLSLSQISV